MRAFLRAALEALFRVLFTYECRGEENVPAAGPAVIAANHPSYLDPVLLSLRIERPIRYMAWDALFRIPLLGAALRLFGAFPVDVRKGRGGSAYARARALLEQGELVGIFPEGKRSRAGWMEGQLREGAVRLAWESGVPLVPATIAGAYRAWPHYQSLPRPARIKVRFHQPIETRAWSGRPAEEAVEEIGAEFRRRVERSLLPGVKADLRLDVIWRLPSPWPRMYEAMPALAVATLVFWKTRALPDVLPAYAYLAYLLLDHFVLPQRRLTKWLRNASPVLFLLWYGPRALEALGLPAVPAGAALVAVTLGSLFPHLYEHGRTALGYIRGLVVAACLALAVQYVSPHGFGPHVTLSLFAAAHAWERRTVFWRYAVPVLLAYVAFWVWGLEGGAAMLPHATAALVAWLYLRLLPDRPRRQPPEEPPVRSLGLDLR